MGKLATMLAVIVVGASACSSGGSSTESATTRLIVRYAVGWGSHMGQCPVGATCSVAASDQNPSGRIHVAQFTLRCDPAGGTYPDPTAACAAIADYIRLLRAPLLKACRCPPQIYPGRAVGTIQGQHVVVSVDSCTACGLGGTAERDLHTLTPIPHAA